MAELVFPLFNMTILGSFLVLAVWEYRKHARLGTETKRL